MQQDAEKAFCQHVAPKEKDKKELASDSLVRFCLEAEADNEVVERARATRRFHAYKEFADTQIARVMTSLMTDENDEARRSRGVTQMSSDSSLPRSSHYSQS